MIEPPDFAVIDADIQLPLQLIKGTGWKNPTWYLNDLNGMNICSTTKEQNAELLEKLVTWVNVTSDLCGVNQID